MTEAGNSRQARRKEILRELGLTPVWRVKAASASSQAPVLAAGSGEPVFGRQVVAIEDRRSGILRMDWEELKTSVEG